MAVSEKILKRSFNDINVSVVVPELDQLEAELKKIRHYLHPDRSAKFTVDLAIARTDSPLGYAGVGIMPIDIGNGVWSLKTKHSDGTTTEYLSSKVGNWDHIEISFTDILFTNEAQPAATSPTFLVWWISDAV